MLYLFEDVAPGQRLEVLPDEGLIKGVKILGLDSANGRRYLPEAVRAAVPHYEGVAVNIDHPTDADGRPRPTRSRSAYDRIGRLENVHYVEGKGLYGDLRMLTTHPMTKRILEAAQHMPELYGLSHNAQGDGHDDQDGVFNVHTITEVRHVDLVADPATTHSLCEDRHMPLTKLTKAQLLEMGYQIEDDETPGADDEMPEVPDEDTTAEEPDEADHLFQAWKKLKDIDPEKANKVLELLQAEEEQAEQGSDETQTSEDDETPGEGEDEDMEEDCETPPDKKKKNGMEGKQAKPKKGQKQILEHCRSLCELAGVKPSKELLEHLTKLPGQSDVIAAIKLFKPSARFTTPRNGSAHQDPSKQTSKPLTEQRDAPPLDKGMDATLDWFRS